MPDEFETVSAGRADRAREIEVMRAHFRRHRESLKRMAADAPTDALAQEYQRLVMSIDGSLAKLDELEGVPASPRLKTEPGVTPAPPPLSPLTQPLAEPVYDDDVTHVDYEPPEKTPVSNARLALIVGAGILVLALIGWVIWKASSGRSADTTASTTTAPIVEETTTTAAPQTASAADETAQEPGDPAQVLSIAPPAHDYGAIRKGTRATRQFEVVNSGTEPMDVVVARSTCRCLYYEYRASVPAKGRETITVTIDGAKAKAGELAETVKVSSKNDPKIVTSFDVTATVR